MKLTLLLDLDQTLLGNNTNRFLLKYLKAFSTFMADWVPKELFIKALQVSSNASMINNDPERTLKEVFDAAFYPAIGLDYHAAQVQFKTFYKEIYPELQNITQVRPAAIELVQTALKRGHQLVLATNPIFPLDAIVQRLEWGGLSADHFTLIPSYETFHFAKPNPAYYSELLAKIGWPETPILMVGDNLEMDIAPTAKMGIKNFWIPNDSNPGKLAALAAHYGSLDAVIPWIDAQGVAALMPDYSKLPNIVGTLHATYPAIKDMLKPVPEPNWHKKATPETWSLTEILCHLRDVDMNVNIPRIQQVLKEEAPFIVGVDTDSWTEDNEYNNQNGFTALASFLEQRKVLLEILNKINGSEWRRSAWHSIFGPTDLQELAKFMGGHDRLHIQQIFNIISSQHP